jgi:hypothetical protein
MVSCSLQTGISDSGNIIPPCSGQKRVTVAARSNTGIVGSNPTRDMYVCVRLFCVCVVLCVGSGLATD